MFQGSFKSVNIKFLVSFKEFFEHYKTIPWSFKWDSMVLKKFKGVIEGSFKGVSRKF